MAQYVDLLPCPRVIDRQKVDWAYHEAMAEVVGAGALDHLREAARFRWWERRLVGAFDRIFVPGAGDEQLLEPLHGPGLIDASTTRDRNDSVEAGGGLTPRRA